jgi:hypothetical protein
MMKRIVPIIFILVLMGASPAHGVFFGTCDGYVKNSTGAVSGATVNVTVVGCTDDGCFANTTSAANGYYTVSNLNLVENDTVSIVAYHPASSGAGRATGTADFLQSVTKNVTMCRAPSTPNLTPEPDVHYPRDASLSWTSGTDPDGRPTHDRYQFDNDSVVENATSPQYESNLDYANHTWGVQTCNPDCCSNWASDAFEVSNNPPPQPSLTDQPDTSNSTVILQWTSGVDPEGDAVHNEYLFQNGSINTSATSPQTEDSLPLGNYTWKVRACDNLTACSAWVSDTFSMVNNPCPAPTLTDEPDGHTASVSLAWASSATDTDGHACHDRFQLHTEAVSDPATSPQNRTGLALGVNYTWQVQSCDVFGACSAWVSDTFFENNTAPGMPSLTDQAHTTSGQVVLTWAPGTDPDNDTTYDQYRLNGGNITNATSPQIEYPSGINYYIWEVRTCDIYGWCSGWANDTFIKYTSVTCAPSEVECPPCTSGAVIYQTQYNRTVIEVACNESWICEAWEPCESCGFQARECVDIRECGTELFKPDTIRECTPEHEEMVPGYQAPGWTTPSLVINIVLLAGFGVACAQMFRFRARLKGRNRR